MRGRRKRGFPAFTYLLGSHRAIGHGPKINWIIKTWDTFLVFKLLLIHILSRGKLDLLLGYLV